MLSVNWGEISAIKLKIPVLITAQCVRLRYLQLHRYCYIISIYIYKKKENRKIQDRWNKYFIEKILLQIHSYDNTLTKYSPPFAIHDKMHYYIFIIALYFIVIITTITVILYCYLLLALITILLFFIILHFHYYIIQHSIFKNRNDFWLTVRNEIFPKFLLSPFVVQTIQINFD